MCAVDASLYTGQKTKICVTLLSWDPVPDLTPDINLFDSPSPSATSSSTGFKKEKSTPHCKHYDDLINEHHPPSGTHEIMLLFDNENTCKLALKYLNSKR